MKVLLLYGRMGGEEIDFVDLSFRVPLGIAYLGAILRNQGYDVQLRDGIFYKGIDEFNDDLKRIKPHVVGISFTTSLKKCAKSYIDSIREILPQARIIAGGAHPTISPEEVIKELGVDFVVYGEGEKTLLELLGFLKNNKNKENNILGVGYELGGKIILNPPRCMIQNLDEIPWPARDLLPMERYLKNAPLMPLPYPATNIVVSKGCFGNCLFCQPTLKKLTGTKVRYRSVEDVIKEIKFLVKEYGVKAVDLGVDEPTFDKKWVMDFCDALIKEKIPIKWGVASRVDTVDEERLQKMGEAGCVYISYGVESGSQKIMNILRKGTKVQQAENALKWTEKAGICGRANIMIGTPGETWETIQETVHFIKRVKPDLIFVAATTPLYGTDLYNLALEEGMLIHTKQGVTGYDFGHLKLNDIFNEDLKKGLNIIVKAYKRNLISFIFNPKMLWRKRHIYVDVIKYFISLLKNRHEFIRMFKFYFNYGRQVRITE